MSQCTEGTVGCECKSGADPSISICTCATGFIARNWKCYSKGCYDPLTDTFCGNYPGGACDNDKKTCNCGANTLVPFNGRCILDTCLTESGPNDSTKIECWGRGYCKMGQIGGECHCFDAYVNRVRCQGCNSEYAIEKVDALGATSCVPRACLDSVNPNVDVVCNSYGSCEPLIDSAGSMNYVCRCNQSATRISNTCYPNECSTKDIFTADVNAICNNNGECNIDSKTCKCTPPYAGTYCGSCLDGFTQQYHLSNNVLSFTCVATVCRNPETGEFCGGHGDCQLSEATKKYGCVCKDGYLLFTPTLCVSSRILRLEITRRVSLALFVLALLIGLAMLCLALYFLITFLRRKQMERKHTLYVSERKIEIARGLSSELRSRQDTYSRSSILSTAEYISAQRRYV